MTITYTGNLKLALPTTGTESGTWGDVVNQQLTALLDQSVAGTVSLTSMTNADYTLTSGNGNAANEARYMAFSIPATLTLTAARNVIVPTSSKAYIVRNLTTGGFAVTVKTSAGTGISVPNGKTMSLYCDGVNVLDGTDYFTAIAVGGLSIAASGQSAALQSLGTIAAKTTALTALYTVISTDRGNTLLCSNTWTLSLTAAATLGSGFSFGVINTGTGTITIDPSGAELIDGVATKSLAAGQSCIVISNGTAWSTLGLSGGGATGGGADQIFYENGQTVTTNYTLTTGKNAMSAGPITIADGITVTVPTGATWSIV